MENERTGGRAGGKRIDERADFGALRNGIAACVVAIHCVILRSLRLRPSRERSKVILSLRITGFDWSHTASAVRLTALHHSYISYLAMSKTNCDKFALMNTMCVTFIY